MFIGLYRRQNMVNNSNIFITLDKNKLCFYSEFKISNFIQITHQNIDRDPRDYTL